MIYSWKTFHLRFLGLDLAYFKNGYVYHTKYDDIQHVSLSSVQRAGDNLLALVSNLAMSDWPSVRDSSDIVIFFDYLGLFMITFSNLSWHLLNITLISLAFYQSINWVTIQDGNLHWTWSITFSNSFFSNPKRDFNIWFLFMQLILRLVESAPCANKSFLVVWQVFSKCWARFSPPGWSWVLWHWLEAQCHGTVSLTC